MAVAGLRGTGDWSADERPKNFRELILWRNPNGMTPIFALSARIGKESTDDPEFAWWTEPNDIVRLQINGAILAAATTVVVNSADPDVANPTLNWGTATHLKEGDQLMVEPAADAAVFAPEIMRVVSVASATTFTVVRGTAGTTAANIADDVFLLLIGSSYAEGTRAPLSNSRNPVKYSNYTQIFKDTYELTGTATETKLRTGDPVKNDKKRKAFDHARAIEMSLLFGQKSEVVGANGKPQRTFDGIRKFIAAQNTKVFTAPYNLNDFINAISPVFDFDTEAGDTRIAFVGNGVLNALNYRMVNSVGQTALRINYDAKATAWGMNFTEVILPQGRILMKSHPLMNRHAMYRNSMLIMDFSALKWRPMRNRDTKFKDNVQLPDEDTKKGYWQTEAGLEVWHGGLTLGWIGGMDQGVPA